MFPGGGGDKIKDIKERVEKVLGPDKGWSNLVNARKNNAARESTTAIVKKYKQLVGTLKRARVDKMIMSGILPAMGSRF